MRAAQAEPEKYRDLVVRIAGYSAYFIELSTDCQNDVISRNENMKKLGIKCMREQEEEIKSCTGKYSEDCVGCGFYNNKEK